VVRPESFHSAVGSLLREGYESATALDASSPSFQRDERYALTLMSADRSVAIDLHRRLLQDSFPGAMDLERVWRRHRWLELDGAKLRRLGPEDGLLYLCMHGSKHCWQRLSWVCDVGETIARDAELDWDELVETARRSRAKHALWLGLLLAHDLVGAPLPASVLSRARSDRAASRLAAQTREGILLGSLDGSGDLARARFQLSLADGPRERLRYLGWLATQAAEPNQLDHAVVRLPRQLRPLYYGVRLVRLLRKYLLGPAWAAVRQRIRSASLRNPASSRRR
jgi:hypothetical protein